MKSRTPLVAAACAAVVLATLGVGPAYATAPEAPGIVDLSTSTPGHVTGTVSTDQAFVLVGVGTTPTDAVDTGAGSGTFDLETWGYPTGSVVHAVACPTAGYDADACSPVATSDPFDPSDVTPAITWSTDTTIGPGQQASVDVADPQGGGDLRARWNATDVAVDRNGTTPLTLADGTGTASLVRCAAGSTTLCVPLAGSPTQAYEVRTSFATPTLDPIDALTSLDHDTTVTVHTDRTGTYSLSWELQNPATHAPVAGFSGNDDGTLLADGSTDAFTVDGTGLADGDYAVVVTVTVTDTDYGQLAPATVSGALHVDRSAPIVSSVTRTTATVYPRIANATRPGSVTFTLTAPNLADIAAVKVRAGVTVVPLARVGNKVTWNGKVGTTVKPGNYTLIVVDALGNSALTTGKVTVSGLQLVLKTYRTTVTARRSKFGQYVGRCSTLRTPSLRRWSGSLGFYANSKCATSGWTASASSTVHTAVLPAAERYVDLRVEVYGGAATRAPRSKALLRYLPTTGSWTAEATMASRLGRHSGRTRSLAGMIFPGRSIYWGFATSDRQKYDVKSFTVVARYYVLG